MASCNRFGEILAKFCRHVIEIFGEIFGEIISEIFADILGKIFVGIFGDIFVHFLASCADSPYQQFVHGERSERRTTPPSGGTGNMASFCKNMDIFCIFDVLNNSKIIEKKNNTKVGHF